MAAGRAQQLDNWIAVALIGSMLPAALVLLAGVQAPYGRYTSTSWGFLINGKLSWVLQELPSFAMPFGFACATYPSAQTTSCANQLLLVAFCAHYVNRTFIFPLQIRGGKPTPFSVFLMALVFCLTNGWLQARALTVHHTYPDAWLYDPRFGLGLALFAVGMFINIQADHILINLRKPGETGYKIPRGGAFEYVSGANFFGECLEWTGFAIACWNLPAFAFAVSVWCNIGPRAIQHHTWYLSKFDDYPKHRRALIPFLI
ncbi:3-oxo-5-alpha-steroid 4-dehydrogenase-domain-containing protein [Pavlovales sp. CCMP2436]|nr:3-oxo-5-alpha-steroid 4-dehydrogenase-domain-containing protein [Pavlovales sp. CCMP2436]